MPTDTIQHTPGPWEISDSPRDAGRHSAAVTGPLSYASDKQRTVAYLDGAGWYANARLIASAPDLLAALEALLRTSTRPTQLSTETAAEFEAANRQYEDAADAATAAIRKARGE